MRQARGGYRLALALLSLFSCIYLVALSRLILFDGGQVNLDIDIFTDQGTSGFQGYVPGQAPVFTVDRGSGAQTGTLLTVGIFCLAIILSLEDNRLRDTMHGEIAIDLVLVVTSRLNLCTLEGNGGILLNIEEIGRA